MGIVFRGSGQTDGNRRRHQKAGAPLPWLPRGPAWALVATVVVAGLLTGLTILRAHRRNHPRPAPAAASRPEAELAALQRTAGAVIGRHLVTKYADRRVLVLLSPPALRDAGEAAALAGLVGAVGDRVTLIMQDLEVGPARIPSPALWLTAQSFDQAVASRPDCGIVLSLVGLPSRLTDMSFWRLPDRPDLVLLNTPVFLLEEMLARGAVDAVLVRRPGETGQQPERPANSPENWLLITSENVTAMAETYHGIFVTRKEPQ